VNKKEVRKYFFVITSPQCSSSALGLHFKKEKALPSDIYPRQGENKNLLPRGW
jgi:hypothetical protein